MGFRKKHNLSVLLLLLGLDLCFAASAAHEAHGHHHCNHDHGHDHHYDHHHGEKATELKLPEELAEEEDMKLFGFGSPYSHIHLHDHEHDHEYDSGVLELSPIGLWVHAMGCSLLVSMASLICLIILPVIFIQGKPSKAVVDSLAIFGAGAMLGDAFLHQLPHAFGGEHSHEDHVEHAHHHIHGHSHSHSLKDLSVGLSILGGIVVFLLVEKVVRYVEAKSGGASSWGHGHHHHHHKNSKKSDDDNYTHDNPQLQSLNANDATTSEGEVWHNNSKNGESHLQKRNTPAGTRDDKTDSIVAYGSADNSESLIRKESDQSPPSNLVFGYLNLFSDGVHNFTDGMALGSAFLLYGSVGGWSRTLFLLAHELPQEIGDFGILVRSGFSISKALFFNFLSALVALAGTALALLVGQAPGQSSLIEGFTAGGFIYIAVAGVLAEMNNNGNSTVKNTGIQLISLILGMGIALCISLVE